MVRQGKNNSGAWLWPAIAILMLGGMVAEAGTHLKPAQADQHQQACKAAIEAIPRIIPAPGGIWSSGPDAKIPDPAVALLGYPVILSRDYVKEGPDGKESVSLLIVDCRDARDLQGHYPPRCYPAQGQNLIWYDEAKKLQGEPRVWHLPGMDLPGMEYHFAADADTGSERVVYNFFITPRVPGAVVSHKELDGVICADMDSVYTSGEDYQRRYFGAAEFQMVTWSQMSRQQRDQAFIDLLAPNENVIRTLENRGPGGK